MIGWVYGCVIAGWPVFLVCGGGRAGPVGHFGDVVVA